jgi:hypothetical protein
MKHSGPPIVATKLLEMFASAPHGDALAGDLVEQYGQGRSARWYWRQVLSAVLICLARDRTRGGPAILGSSLVILLVIVSVGRHPASLGIGLLTTDLALLSANAAFSVWVCRQRSGAVRFALTAGAHSGIVLGLVLIASHATEWFGILGSRPAALFRGIGSVLLMLALLGTAGSAAWQRTRSRTLAAAAGLWCGTVAVLMLLSFAFTLNLVFERHATAWLHESFAASGMSDAGAYVVRNALKAASEILVRIPIAALVLAICASVSTAWITKWPRPVTIFAASFTPLLFVAGVACLWYLDSLARADRPPFVLAGLMMTGIALSGAHPLWLSLHGAGGR